LNIVYYPTHKIRIPVHKENVLKSGIVKEEDAHLIVDYIDIDLPKSAIGKNRILMLDILANNNWERPIYFSGGSFDPGEYLWMKEYLQLDGLTYKLVPIKTENRNAYDLGRIDSELMYDIVMDWDWGNSEDPKVYLDTQTRIQGLTFRGNLARLTETLIEEESYEKAKEIIDLSLEKMPVEKFGFYSFVEPFLAGYFQIGAIEEGIELYEQLKFIYQDRLNYYASINYDFQYQQIESIVSDLEGYRRIVDLYLLAIADEENTTMERELFNSYVDKFGHFYSDSEEDAPKETEDTLNLSH
jgi:tetratricopeptide (TPR) repeat protein